MKGYEENNEPRKRGRGVPRHRGQDAVLDTTDELGGPRWEGKDQGSWEREPRRHPVGKLSWEREHCKGPEVRASGAHWLSPYSVSPKRGRAGEGREVMPQSAGGQRVKGQEDFQRDSASHLVICATGFCAEECHGFT